MSDKKTYECWAGEEGISFFPSDNAAARALMPAGHELRYVIEADSWEEAMTEHYKRQGWEPYKP